MKYFIHIFCIVLIAFVVITVLKNQKQEELPTFVKVDEIAKAHKTEISTSVQSFMKPTEQQIELLEKDYSAMWGHLNHLYASNEVEAGTEYYTEDFFKAICLKTSPVKALLQRKDVKHKLTITEWARDGLVCVGIDSNVILKYQTLQNETFYTKATIAFALLLQGEHWRIDGLKFIEEKKYIVK